MKFETDLGTQGRGVGQADRVTCHWDGATESSEFKKSLSGWGFKYVLFYCFPMCFNPANGIKRDDELRWRAYFWNGSKPATRWRVFLSGKRPLYYIATIALPEFAFLIWRPTGKIWKKCLRWLGAPGNAFWNNWGAEMRQLGGKIAMSWGSISPGGRKGIDSIEKISIRNGWNTCPQMGIGEGFLKAV